MHSTCGCPRNVFRSSNPIPLQPIRPTLILSEGAHPARAPDSEETRPNPAVVIAVFFTKTLRDVISGNIL
jgi:hypothetical protein